MILFLAAGSLAACGVPGSTPSGAATPGSNPPGATTPGASASPSAPVDATAAAIGRAFVEALAAGDMAKAEQMEDATLRGAAPAAALATLWAQLVGQFGDYRGTGAVTTESKGDFVNAAVETFFANNTVPLLVTVDRAGAVAGLHLGQPGPASSAAIASPTATVAPAPSGSPAAYVDPAAFSETEVTVGADPWTLPGTLSMPNGDGPFPAVVLVAGSGPQDRDETVGPNKPLRDIAWGLASKGIAVLRYEKRTRAHGSEMAADTITVREEAVDDAVIAVDLLRATARIDPDRIVVAGHSLGGYLAPRIARQASGRVAGIALLEGSISPLEDLIAAQLAYLASAEGGADPQAKAMLEALPAQLQAVRSPDLSPDTPASSLPLGIPAAYWLDLRDYRPGAVAAGLGIPILVVQGGRDYQVPPSEAERWRTALAGARDVTITLYPALNHLLLAGEGPSRPAEYATPGHVDQAVVTDLAAWVRALP